MHGELEEKKWTGMVGVFKPGDIPFYGQGTYYAALTDGRIFKKDRNEIYWKEVKEEQCTANR